MSYKLVVEESALEVLLALPAKRRESILRTFDSLSQNPFQEGDFSVKDDAQRSVQIKYADGILITYWADHAVQELRVVAVELA